LPEGDQKTAHSGRPFPEKAQEPQEPTTAPCTPPDASDAHAPVPTPLRPPQEPTAAPTTAPTAPRPGQWDFDLSEFPVFRFDRHCAGSLVPLVYTDTITVDGERVPRRWECHPGTKKGGGATAAILLYSLFQIWAEGDYGPEIRYGTLRSLFQRQHPGKHPSSGDYRRLKDDLWWLERVYFKTQNAFYDPVRKCYISKNWGLFQGSCTSNPSPDSSQGEFNFGVMYTSNVLQEIADGRGLFSVGIHDSTFYALKPLERRLAIFLARRFRYHKVVRLPVDRLRDALPIGAKGSGNVRGQIRRATKALQRADIPWLGECVVVKNGKGVWMADFKRSCALKDDYRRARRVANAMDIPAIDELVERIISKVGGDRGWWKHCIDRLGMQCVESAMGWISDYQNAKNLPALLTSRLKLKAAERGITLIRSKNPK